MRTQRMVMEVVLPVPTSIGACAHTHMHMHMHTNTHTHTVSKGPTWRPFGTCA